MQALIIDDSTFTRRFLEAALQEEGVDTVDMAATGEEAVRLFEKNTYDLVLLDIILDDTNGIDVLQDLRTIDADTPIVMVSVIDDEERIEEALDRGATAFIAKPLKKDDLRATLADVLP